MRVIAGSARSIPLLTPEGDIARPTTDRIKETLFNIIMDEVGGARFLDLFAGSGQIGIEAISRGAEFALFVEKNKKICELISKNLKKTGFTDRAAIKRGDVISAIPALSEYGTFDLIYMDPPYDSNVEEDVLKKIAENDLLADDGMVIIEASLNRMIDPLDTGFEIFRVKEYKTNKHIFMRKK